MLRTAAAGRHISCPTNRSIRLHGRRAYSDGPTKAERKVQTPFQSQKTDKIALNPFLKPEAESTQMQTPMQSQNPADFTLQPAQHSAQPPSFPAPQSRPRPNNAGPLTTFFVSLLAIPAIAYGYYNYRKEHMDKKWESLLKDAAQKQQRS